MLEFNLIKVLVPWIISFLLGFLITPYILKKLIEYKVWRKNKNSKGTILDNTGKVLDIINKNEKDMKTPRMGGLVIVISVVATVILFWVLSYLNVRHPSGTLDILSRKETWLPFASFIAGALIGLFDDYFTVKSSGKFSKGLPLKYRLVFVTIFATFSGWWFYVKLGYENIKIPFLGDFHLGLLFIPFFILVFVSVFATSNIDGLDGLSGGIMAVIYSIMGFIAFYQDKFDIAAFSFVVVGAVLAFLWFNIPPAKFYMSEIGYNALSFALVIIAFMTDTVLLLPIIAFPLFINLVMTVLQVFWLRVFKKRLIKVAPLHHHFEAIGWEQPQIVMRYWIVALISGISGLVLAILSI